MTYRYRCRDRECQRRTSLPRLKERYIRTPRCPACGKDSLRRDAARNLESKRKRCWCDGYHFPHREGSAPWCKHAHRLPTPDDYEQRHGHRAA